MNVDFITAIKLFFANYVNFRGRSTRAEYWFAVLFVFIVSMLLTMLGMSILANLFTLAVFLPNMAICFRRFHDTGRSGWWVIALVVLSLIGAGVMYVPMIPSIIQFANNPLGLQQALATYITSHIGTVCTGGIIAMAAFVWQLIILVKPSAPDNKYGPNPYGENE